jgi:hypothetical protein
MPKTGWLALWSLLLIGLLAADHWVASAALNERKERGYPPPSVVRYNTNLTDEQLLQLARFQARETSTRSGRLGVIEPGKKGLITITDDQDLRVVKACIKALQERGADADYIYTSDLLEKYGYPREWANPMMDRLDPNLRPLIWELKSYFSGGLGFFSNKARTLIPADNEQLIIKAQKAFDAKADATKKYLNDHPEYSYVFLDYSPGGPEFSRLNWLLGSKYQIGWRIPNISALIAEGSIPNEIRNAMEDKVMEVIPWVEHVHVTDPEGTDIEFSVTPDEAQIWRQGAYMPDYLRLYPLQACRYLYQSLGIKRVVAPEAKGTIAGTLGHGNYFPRIVMTVEGGVVQKIEGGGLRGDLERDLLNKYKDFQLPLLHHPGWFNVFQTFLGTNVADGGGEIIWGFGAELYIPEIEEYGKKHGIPIAHDMHMNQGFSTWEGTVSGGKKIKLLDKGYLVAADDPEVRLIASKYGDPDDLLRSLNRRAIPGINAPGNYEEYARDPWKYVQKEREQIKAGTYPYIVKLQPLQLQAQR